MISLLQAIYSFIFSPFAELMQKSSSRLKNSIIFLCALLISAYYIIDSEESIIPYIESSSTRIHLMCGFFLLVLVIFSAHKPLQPVRWNRYIFYLMFFFGFGMMIISIYHRIGSGYRVFSLLLMFGFPALYYVWNNRMDYNTLFQMFSISFILTGVFVYLFFIYLSLCGRLEMPDNRVSPNMNANLFAMFGMVMITSATYLLFLKGPDKKWIIINTLAIGIGLDIVLLSQSRSCLLVVFGDIICAFIFYIKLRKAYANHYRPTDLILLLSFLILFIISFIFVGSYAVAFNAETQKDVADITSSSTVEIYSTTNAGSNPSQPESHIEYTSKKTTADDNVVDRFSMDNIDLDRFTSGRLSVWKWYYSHLNLWGNDVYEVSIEKETGNYYAGAHNTFLDYAFRFGVPVAFLHLILELSVGILSLWVLFDKRFTNPIYLFSALAVMVYAIQSMVEIALLPFDRQAVLLFYLAITPLLSMYTEVK